MGEEQSPACAIELSAIAAHFFERMQIAANALPLIDEPALVLLVRQRKRLLEYRRGCVHAVAKSKSDGEFVALREIDFADDRNVAVLRAIVFPIQFEVVVQILPAIAGAHKTAGRAREARTCVQSKISIVLPCHQNVPAGKVHLHGRIVPPANIKMRSEQKINLQLVSPPIRRNKPGMYQHAGGMWIRDNFLLQPVTPFRVNAGYTITKRLGFNSIHHTGQIAFFFVEEGGAIADEELCVTDLRPVNGGIVDFRYD